MINHQHTSTGALRDFNINPSCRMIAADTSERRAMAPSSRSSESAPAVIITEIFEDLDRFNTQALDDQTLFVMKVV